MKSFSLPTAVVVVMMVLAVGTTANRVLPQPQDSLEVYIWPLPVSVIHGEIGRRVFISKNLQMHIIGGYGDRDKILEEGFSRFLGVVMKDHVVSSSYSSSLLEKIHVSISSSISKIQYGVDESYKLEIPSPKEKQFYIKLEAETVYGALHGFETLSQLCEFDSETELVQVKKVPWVINDRPSFSYRAVMIDTARHYLPIREIEKIIDEMAYSKMNVLHLHIVDKESFPLQIPSYPLLWKGSFTETERYTIDDVALIVKYAEIRGINVLLEIDVPGHAASWGKGYPDLWPREDCQQPLDVSKEFTFEVINGIIRDLRKINKFKFIHLGGDEVETNCWTDTPHVMKWLTETNRSASDAYEYFVLRVQEIARSHEYEVINWQETFTSFGEKMNKQTVIHNWLSGVASADVTAAGFRCIVSNMDAWYLNFVDTRWQKVYMNNPLQNIINLKEKELVMGGEVCMWGENVDTSDTEETLWPRAAAAAEVLWTPHEKRTRNTKEVVEKRLTRFRCLLNERGVAASPITGPGRVLPDEPKSCFAQ